MGWIFEILFEKNIRIIRFVLNRSYLLNNFRIRLLIKGRKWNRRLYMYIYIWIFDHRDARSILREVEGKSGEGVEN